MPDDAEHPSAEDLSEFDLPQAVIPDYAEAIRQAVIPDYAEAIRQAVIPDYTEAIRQAVIPDYTKLVRELTSLPSIEAALRSVVAPRFASSMLSSVRPSPSGSATAGLRVATKALFETMGLDSTSDLQEVDVRPTTDASAFMAIAEASPEVAAAISAAAETAGNPLLPAHIIRNMLAWLVASIIVVAYVGGTALFPPWGPIVVALLSASGVTAPAAFGKIRQTADEDELRGM